MENKIEKLKEERERLLKAKETTLAPLYKRIEEIDNLLWQDKLSTAEKMVGKCFVYKDNCYSCPQSEKDYWDTYYKITALHNAVDDNDYDHFCILEIQKDSYGLIGFKQFNEGIGWVEFGTHSKYKPISPEEFDEQFNALLKEIAEVCK